jgi:hypothetical protein
MSLNFKMLRRLSSRGTVIREPAGDEIKEAAVTN